jgi:hypothetical protein
MVVTCSVMSVVDGKKLGAVGTLVGVSVPQILVFDASASSAKLELELSVGLEAVTVVVAITIPSGK